MCKDRLKNEIEYERKGFRLEAMTILLVLIFASVVLSLYNSKRHSENSNTLNELTEEIRVAVVQSKEVLGKIQETASNGPEALIGAAENIQAGITTLQSSVDHLAEMLHETRNNH